MMDAFGDPHLRVPAVHIAGTNGKGSVAAMTDCILRRAGFRVGLYTSPHLERPLERIRVDGREIRPGKFADLVSRVRRQELKLLRKGLLDIPLTYFEFITACMFQHFAEAKVRIAVVEVGLGGSLDATNIVRPAVCVITGISLDHQTLLGHTLAQIAAEKAGIIKTGIPVISGAKPSEARNVIRNQALAAGSPLVEIDRACKIRFTNVNRGRVTMDLETPCRRYHRLALALAGEHQARNAALAVMSIEALRPFRVPVPAIRAGLIKTRWPGRLDEYRCPGRTLLDGAHNAEGAQMLRDFLRKHGTGQVHLVFGVLRDKDFCTIGRRLFPLADSIHLCPIPSTRSAHPEEVASVHGRFRRRFRFHGSASEALRAAWRECSPGGLVVVTGSLYLLGELMPLIRSACSTLRRENRQRRLRGLTRRT
jgi:dihydrofolate synthase/folylpolyglutamate synthase